MKTVLALDIDGVLNPLNRELHGVHPLPVGAWQLAYRPNVMRLLRPVLRRRDVIPVWLTRWQGMPDLLDQVTERLGLGGLVSEIAEYPLITTNNRWETPRPESDARFPGPISMEPTSAHWWKFRSMELLTERFEPDRLAWVDDDLGRATSPQVAHWDPVIDARRCYLWVNGGRGMLPRDVRTIRGWLDGDHDAPAEAAGTEAVAG